MRPLDSAQRRHARQRPVREAPHHHDWQANGTTERTVSMDGGFVRARQTFAVQS